MAKKTAPNASLKSVDARKQGPRPANPEKHVGFWANLSITSKILIGAFLFAGIVVQSYFQVRLNSIRVYRQGQFYDGQASLWQGVWSLDQIKQQASTVFSANITNLFTTTARPISSPSDLESEVVALADDELFFWPVVKIGHVASITLDGRPINVTTVSASPRAFVVDNFLSHAEADHLIKRAKHDLKMWDSKVGDSAETSYYDSVRTSSQVWIGPSNAGSVDQISTRIKARVLALTGLPDYCEDIQVVHYDPMEHYYPHHDWIDRSSVGQGQRAHKYYAAGGNRVITVLFYLNDVEEGGETRFPMTGAKYHPRMSGPEVCSPDFECLSIKPRKGSAIMFYNLLEKGHMQGATDPMSLHTGCDVLKGEKFAANQWIRNKIVDGIMW
eukprot:TRINITY_DN18717_c0_g1_i1.p1 TRINITY_DN18717_c0_g1~~TRINITY_DN18717_c0_g1_i1.p1  ORF type:complete len:386 (-),score=52.72 TRINITY_DN18717_c0_g1_i1:141-1298(-)